MITAANAIVVTGAGSVSAAGVDLDALWQSVVRAQPEPSRRSLDGVERPVYSIVQLPEPRVEERVARPADRTVWLALAAAREAVREAALSSIQDRSRIGLFIGSSRGPCGFVQQSTNREAKRPTDSVYSTFASISGVLAQIFDIAGGSSMYSATCVSGAVALKNAAQALQLGEIDYAVVGGVDAPLVESLLREFVAVGVMSCDALRPFDRERRGTVLGEGAAFVVLERNAAAEQRGARVLGRLLHVALGTEPSHRAGGGDNAEVMAAAMDRVLRFSRVTKTQVDLLHLHGTGTRTNDANESRAVERAFGADAPRAWASKGVTGHVLGASALFQVVLTLRAMQERIVPATANLREVDPACPVRVSAKAIENVPLRTALCLTSGFWGNVSCIGLQAPE